MVRQEGNHDLICHKRSDQVRAPLPASLEHALQVTICVEQRGGRGTLRSGLQAARSTVNCLDCFLGALCGVGAAT